MSRDIEVGKKCQLWRVDRQSHTANLFIYKFIQNFVTGFMCLCGLVLSAFYVQFMGFCDLASAVKAKVTKIDLEAPW